MLLDMNFHVLEAENASQALEIAERDATPIDLLLTDVVMPRINGWVLAETLSRTRPEIKVVYMSGYPDGVIAKHGLLKPGTPILRKPFSREELERRIEELAVTVSR